MLLLFSWIFWTILMLTSFLTNPPPLSIDFYFLTTFRPSCKKVFKVRPANGFFSRRSYQKVRLYDESNTCIRR